MKLIEQAKKFLSGKDVELIEVKCAICGRSLSPHSLGVWVFQRAVCDRCAKEVAEQLLGPKD